MLDPILTEYMHMIFPHRKDLPIEFGYLIKVEEVFFNPLSDHLDWPRICVKDLNRSNQLYLFLLILGDIVVKAFNLSPKYDYLIAPSLLETADPYSIEHVTLFDSASLPTMVRELESIVSIRDVEDGIYAFFF